MYHNIIISLSLEHGISQAALRVARALSADNARITAVHVYELPSSSVNAFLEQDAVENAFKKAEALLAERVAGESDIEAIMLKGHSGRAITDHAEKKGADCIIVGSHKPGLRDYFLGSTAARVVRHAPCAVHVLR